jgi:hypothetical protein
MWLIDVFLLVPSFHSIYQEEHLNVGVPGWSWLGCYSGWFGPLLDQIQLLDYIHSSM